MDLSIVLVKVQMHPYTACITGYLTRVAREYKKAPIGVFFLFAETK